MTPSPKPVKTYSPEKLLAALYFIWDAFERTNMPYFLVYKTAESAMKNKDLEGDKIEVGVRDVEWRSGGRRIFDAFVTPLKEDENTAYYEHEGVPILVHIFADSECIRNTDMVRYKYEEFKIPNPYQEFLTIYATS